MRVGIGNDHAAVNFKNILKEYLENKGFEVIDYGSTDPQAKDDYPDFGQAVAEALVAGKIDKGVVICGTGVGISLAANKVPGIRCGVCSDTATARLIVQHNNANMISLGERIEALSLLRISLTHSSAQSSKADVTHAALIRSLQSKRSIISNSSAQAELE